MRKLSEEVINFLLGLLKIRTLVFTVLKKLNSSID